MMIDKFPTKCSKCGEQQFYYKLLFGGGGRERPKCLDNICSNCGIQLQEGDDPNLEELIKKEWGDEGPKGFC